MFDMFNCIDIDGEDRMKNDLEVVCYDSGHWLVAMFVALPSIIVWGLGIPLFAMILISTERKKLDSVETREKYGFLFRGYKKRYFFWEGVVMYRKIILIFISVFVGRYGLIVQVSKSFVIALGSYCPAFASIRCPHTNEVQAFPVCESQ
jgi:hypothetical protein